MTAQTAAADCTPARIAQLAASHRATQAAHRNALAAESPAAAAASRTRMLRITDAVRDAGCSDLAAALDAETSTGAVLLALLIAEDDTSITQVTTALAEYQKRRGAVDHLIDAQGWAAKSGSELA